jgi:hypothetical protein
MIDYLSGHLLYLFIAEHSYTVMKKDGTKIVYPGNNPGTSKGAEPRLLTRALRELAADVSLCRAITGVVTDADAGSAKVFNEHPDPWVRNYLRFLDSGHCKKGVQKTVKDFCGSSEDRKSLPCRVGLMYMGTVKHHTSNINIIASVHPAFTGCHKLFPFFFFWIIHSRCAYNICIIFLGGGEHPEACYTGSFNVAKYPNIHPAFLHPTGKCSCLYISYHVLCCIHPRFFLVESPVIHEVIYMNIINTAYYLHHCM